MIIAVVSQKGGVGKTTVAVGLAGALMQRQIDALLIDADPQGSASAWFGRALKYGNEWGWPAVVRVDEDEIYTEVKRHADQADVTVIDAPPRLGNTTRSLLGLADLAIVVLTPSPLDLDAVDETCQLVELAQSDGVNPDLAACLLLSRVDMRKRISREIRMILEDPPFGEIPLLDSQITDRVQVVEAGIMGNTIQAYAPGSTTDKEFAELADVVLAWWAGDDDNNQETEEID